MDRSNKYMTAVERQYRETEYRDYFADFLSLLCRCLSHYAFRLVLAVSCFMGALLLVVGIAGVIEREMLSYACAAPLFAMLTCLILLLNKLRK